MKFITTITISITILIAGCSPSSSKHLARANYDAAIYKAVKKLRKNPTKEKEIDVLRQAYPKANQQNLDRIQFLKASREQETWDEIYHNYSALKQRQETLKTLPDRVLNAINFVPKNYDQEVLDAKKNAATYFYDHAVSLLAKNDKYAARQAYDELLRVKKLYPNYKDLPDRLQEAHFKGTTNVLFKMQNKTNVILPHEFEEDLLKISVKDLNTLWLNYDSKANPAVNYDYSILLIIRNIAITPQQQTEEVHTEQSEVEDGYTYAKDKKGNVMKDTAGNDIKVPKIKIITCKVIETHQFKKAMVSGTLDYIDNRTGQLIKTDPIMAEAIFENHAAIAIGDINALKPETLKKTGNKPLPFPSDPDLIMQAGITIKNLTKDIIWENKELIK